MYKATVASTGEQVAIKVIDVEQCSNWDELHHETKIMASLHHPNIVGIKASFVVNSELWIVMPLLTVGSCLSLMKRIAPQGFKDEIFIATILKETLQGLIYAHENLTIHRDVKANNILLGGRGEVQLCDFGIAGIVINKTPRHTFTGTPCWMAPEVMENTTGHDDKADIWSFGITAMELGFGYAPYAQYHPMKAMIMTLTDEPPTIDMYGDDTHEFSCKFTSMISCCLKKDPKERPSARQLIKHKFFKQAKDSEYLAAKINEPR